jgi:hypothetical protein
MIRIACFMLCLAAASAARAQATKAGDLVPIEQGVSDMNSVGTSLRIMPVDLGTGNSFTRLYGVAGRPDLLVRSQGGIYAVFEQSDYVRVQRQNSSRVYAVWPAGTVFHIGQPDFGGMRTAGIRHGPQAAMLFAPGLQPPVPKKSSAPDRRLSNRVSSGPMDRPRPSSRIETQRPSTSGEARWEGGLPGYVQRPTRPAAVAPDTGAPADAAPQAAPKPKPE